MWSRSRTHFGAQQVRLRHASHTATNRKPTFTLQAYFILIFQNSLVWSTTMSEALHVLPTFARLSERVHGESTLAALTPTLPNWLILLLLRPQVILGMNPGSCENALPQG